MSMRKGPVIAALYPVGMLFIQLFVSIGFSVILINLVQAVFIPHLGVVGYFIALTAGFGFFIGTLNWFRKQDNKIFAYYLMHDYAFSAQCLGAYSPALEARMSMFAQIIADSMADDVDEILIVGHSSGAHLAVSIIADLLRTDRIPKDGPLVGFLSLGQVVPMMSFLPNAHRLSLIHI